MMNSVKGYISILDTINKISKYEIKTQPTINSYCKRGKIPAKMISNKWFIKEEYIIAALKWRETVYTLKEIGYMKLVDYIKSEQWIKNSRNLARNTKKYYVLDFSYSLLFVGPFIDKNDINEVAKVIDTENEWINVRRELLPIADVASEMQVSRFRLMSMINDGIIKGCLIKNNWYINRNEIQKYYEMKNKYISIYELAKEIAEKNKTIFDIDNKSDRAQLNSYLSASSYAAFVLRWKDVGFHDERRNSLYFPATMKEVITKEIEKYMKNFGKKTEIKEMLGLSEYWKKYPKTKKALDEFSTQKTDIGMAALYEIIINSISCEIMECSNADIEVLKNYAENAETKIYVKYLVLFLKYCKKKYDCRFTLELMYNPNKVKAKAISTKPYTIKEYYKMAYMTFNEEFIYKNDLVNKAINNPQNAYVWLFVAMHFVSAWRKSDIENLPIVVLPYDLDVTLKKICDKSYLQDAINTTLLLQDEINNSYQQPSKTINRQKERFLTIEIPTSLRIVFGTIYSIYNVHVQKKHYINKRLITADYIRFFGNQYVAIFGNAPFSNRRANKTFLDEIIEITERKQGINRKVMGYKVASYARAHIENGNGIAEVTSKYLQTKMDGLSVNEILMLLFETGTCSFVPFFLLEIIYGKKFSDLNVQDQTEVMKMFKLNAYGAEMLSKALDTSYRRMQGVVESIFSQYKSDASKSIVAEQMLNNIVNRTALSKTIGISCVCAAKRLPCPFPNRKCPGCIYGIYEMSFFFHAMDKIKTLYSQLEVAKTLGEQKKIQMIIDNEVLPAIVEILKVASSKYKMNIEQYKNELIELINSKGSIEKC